MDNRGGGQGMTVRNSSLSKHPVARKQFAQAQVLRKHGSSMGSNPPYGNNAADKTLATDNRQLGDIAQSGNTDFEDGDPQLDHGGGSGRRDPIPPVKAPKAPAKMKGQTGY